MSLSDAALARLKEDAESGLWLQSLGSDDLWALIARLEAAEALIQTMRNNYKGAMATDEAYEAWRIASGKNVPESKGE